MNDKFWMIKYSLSVLAAALVSQVTTIISGYGISGFMVSVELTIFLVFISAFTVCLYRLYRNKLTLNPNPTKGFNAKDNNDLFDIILFKNHPSMDLSNNISLNPLLVSSNIINPLSILAIIYLAFSCNLRIVLLHSEPTVIDFLFLMGQTWVVYCSFLIYFMALFQSRSIYKFLIIKVGINPLEATVMKILQQIFGMKDRKTSATPVADMRTLNLNGKGKPVKEYLDPVVRLLTRSYAPKFVETYQTALHLQSELINASKEFNVSESYFSDDLIIISEILDVYYPDVVAKSKKALSNTNMFEQIKDKFQQDMQKSIVSNIEQFGFKIKRINNKILALRLSAFDTTDIDPYIASAKGLHRQIKLGSGDWSNKHLVIANSVINELLPSMIDSWALSNDPEQREFVLDNFKEMVDFLQSQLDALQGASYNSIENNNPKLALELDRAVDLGELNIQIQKQSQYIKNLKNHWN